ncbi:MmgE/PrpD family protein [Rhodobacteraceae bacterium CCMM004]|nr:MmgE/PrpD family protein [Rhodobacteraceae bacterium CCMM004]
MADGGGGVAGRLADFAAAADPDAGAREVLALSAVDWAACGLAGADEPAAAIVRQMVLGEGGRGEAALIGGGRAPARAAAAANGTAAHALDYDDTHFAHIGHPSVAVLPAALAMAERTGAGWDAFAPAALVGLEASVRMGVWLGRGHYQAGFHQTATAGAFGAALAAARLAGCDRGTTVHALGLTATRAAGLKAQFGTMGKPWNAGQAAATGVEAALLAAAGMTSRASALDGAQGFAAVHAGAADPAAWEGLGEIWRICDVSYKFHACCHGLHATLEALRGVHVDADAVTAVEVAVHPRWRTVCDIAEPESGLEAKFSYRLAVALALAGRDTAALDTWSDAAAHDPGLTRLRDLVTVRSNPGLAETAAEVAVRTATGGVEMRRHDIAGALVPSDRAARLAAKARSLVGPRRAAALETAVVERDLPAFVAALSRTADQP